MSLFALRSASLAGRKLAAPRTVAAAAAATKSLRFYASGSQPQQPQAKAQSIIDALPGSSTLSKSGILATGAAAAIYAIGNSLYVLNAESCLLGVFATFIVIASKTVAPAYREWADGHVAHIAKTLNSAREQHVVAVQDRIDSVARLDNVVGTTKDLFAVSKQTVELEARAFELEQKVEIAAKAKAVLDSWVRYESQVRTREQADLVASVTAKVEKQISSEKFQADALKQALADVETAFKSA